MVTTARSTEEIPAPVAFLRWLARQLLALLLILTLAVLAVMSLLMVNRQELLRRAVVLHLRHALQRDVSLGDITLDPHGQAVLTNLVIYDGLNSTRRAWSAKRIALRFDPLRLTAYPKLPVSAIESVQINDPYLIITRNRKGQWNFQDLIKPRTPTKDRFRGEVVVYNGEIVFRDDQGFLPGGKPLREHLVRVNARTTRAGGDFMPFRVSALSVGGHLHAFSATGNFHTAGRGEGTVRLGKVELARLQEYLPPTLPINLISGEADARLQVALRVNPRTKQADWQATVVVDLRDVSGSMKLQREVIPCVIQRGQLRYADGVVELVDLHGWANGIPLQLDGTIANFDRPTFALQVAAHEAPTDALLALLPGMRALPYKFAGKLDGWAHIVGSAGDVQVYGHAGGLSVYAPFGEFHEVKGDISYTSDAFQATNVTATGFGGMFAGSLWVVTAPGKSPQALVNGEMTGVGIQHLTRQFLPDALAHPSGSLSLTDIDGTLSGPVTIEIARNGHVSLSTRARGNVQVAGLTHGDVDSSLQLEIDGDEVTTRVERLTAYTPEGMFQAEGTIAPDLAVQLTVRGSGLDLAAVGAYFDQKDLRGTGFVNGHLDGPHDRLAFSGSLHVQDGAYAGHAFTDLYSDVQVALSPAPVLALRDTRLMAGSSRITLPQTRITADPERRTWTADGKVVLPRTSLADLGKAINVELPLDGLVEGDVSFDLTPDAQTAGGTLQLRYPVFHTGNTDVELENAKLAFALERDTLTITSGEVLYRDTPFNVTGAVTLDPATRKPTAFDLQLNAKAVGLDLLTKYVDSDDPLLGKLTKDLRVALPVDVDGRFDLDVNVTAKLPPGAQPTAEVLAKALTVTVTAEQVGELKLARIPYQQFTVELEYQGKDEILTLRRLHLAREAGGRAYRIALTEKDGELVPAVLNLGTTEIEMNLALGSANDNHADLDLLRRDLLALTVPFTADSPLGGMRTAVNSLPLPFAGKGAVYVALSGTVNQPMIAAGVSVRQLTVGGNTMPNIAGNVTYEMVSRTLTFGRTFASDTLVLDETLPDNLVLSGGPDPDATAELSGTTILPVKDQDGKDLVPGDLNLEFQAMYVDPSLIGLWMRNPQIRELKGNATIVTSITGTPANPVVQGSIDVTGLGYGNMAFDSLFSVFKLENDRLVIGRESLEGDGAAAFHLKDSEEPVEFYGYLPITWLGTLHPDVAVDQPLHFVINLPKQGLSVVKAYLPQVPAEIVAALPKEEAKETRTGPAPAALASDSEKTLSLRGNALAGSTKPARPTPQPAKPKPADPDRELFALPVNGSWDDAIRIALPKLPEEAGTIAGSLEVRGTRLKPEIVNGVFTARVPEVILPVADENLPNRLRDVNLELAFKSKRSGNAWVNTLEVKDCSAVYDRDSVAKAPKRGKLDWLKKLLGTDSKEIPFRPGAMVAGGTISFDMADASKLSADKLDYDIYAKVLRAPLRWKDTFHGTVSSYLHLGNNPKTHRPQIRGVVYAENGRMTYAGGEETEGEAAAPKLAFNPELQVAVQLGAGNMFEITQDNPLYQNTVSAMLPFVGTPLFSPIAMTDQPYLSGKREKDGTLKVSKPPLDSGHLPYQYTAATLQPYAGRGTCAWVTGTLAQPVIEAHFVLAPGKAQVQLPGGALTVRQATGRMLWDPFNPELAPADRLQLTAKGEATGTVDKYTVAMRVDGNILEESRETSPFQFITLNTPSGMPPLSSSEIQARLTGLSSIADLLRGDRQIMSSLYERAPMFLFGGWFRKAADKLGLETFAFTFDQTMTPEMTLVTSEFGKSRFGSFRLGWTQTYSDLPTWTMWGDYKFPDIKFLRNMSISADTNERGDRNVNLQYKIEF
ncbi:MAG: DUF748 domain-containing protein [Armatimonadota bacterium]